MLSLLFDPGNMTLNLRIFTQKIQAAIVFSQCHLVEEFVNAAVALATKEFTTGQLLFAEVPTKVRAPVNLARYQVVKL